MKVYTLVAQCGTLYELLSNISDGIQNAAAHKDK